MSGGYPPGATQWHIDYYAGGYDMPRPGIAVFCEGGTLFEPYRAEDGSEGAVEIGDCDAWPGCGCQWDLPAPEGGCYPVTEDDLDEWWGE